MEPDILFTEPIHGVRTWEVVDGPDGEPLLCGWAVNQVWPPGERYRAACVARSFPRMRVRGRLREPHLAPHPDCSCGIYAYHPARLDARRELVDKLSRCESSGVIGAIEAWGRLEVHEQGFRAEQARPVVLYRCGTPWEASRDSFARLAEAYGVGIVELDDISELRGALAELGGLDRRVVRRLVAEALDLELEPFREERKEPFGGTRQASGFRPAPPRRDEQRRRLPQPRYLSFVVEGGSAAVLRDERFNLCRDVELREVRPPSGPRRIEVTARGCRLRAGWVPAGLCSEVRRLLREPGARAIVAAHERYGRDGPRQALEVLVTPHPRVSVWVGKPRRKVPLDAEDPVF